ncbi:MAG: hypothetical protein DRJ99_01480 [Thermoplasmata archaeon]|nr:MAG: hypothetical protein DRJ99_01480 [Thermoplasmata archaeon]
MKKRIVCILVCMLFVISAFGVMSYGKVVRTAREISTINESSIKFRGETYSYVFAKVTPLDEKIFITNILQPAVVITSPEDGAVVTDPHLTVLGYASDEAGMNYWEWEWHYQGGSYSNSSYFETAEYVEFKIDIYGLHPGWNLVIVRFKNIYGSMGEDSVNVTYNPPDDQPPTVTIDSPENGATVTNPHITVTGLVTDNVGVVSIGAKQKWSEGQKETSSTIPPTTYYPFEWDFDLYDGWNEITIYAEDAAGNKGEDTINVTYAPEGAGISFIQLNLNLEGTLITDSCWGEAIIEYEQDDEIMYLNLAVNEEWIVQNLPIMPVGNEFVIDFDLKIENGTEVTYLEYAYELTSNPLETMPSDFQTAIVRDGSVTMYSGETGITPTFTIPKIMIGCGIVDGAWHKLTDIVNQPCGIAECVPAAISNSLKFLNKKHGLGMNDNDISIDKMKTATGWANGCPFGWRDKKKRYMEDNKYPIETTIYDEKVDLDKIIKEIRRGQDVELRVPGHAAMIAGIVKLANGKYVFGIAHDTKQGQNGGEQIQFSVYDPTTGKFTNGKWINGRKLSRIIVECPKKENKPPNKPNKPSGPTSGKAGTSYTYSTSTTDPDEDQVYYWFDWGDRTNSGWLGPYNSGQTVGASHTWSEKGSYDIKVKAKDTNDAESDWSDPLPITMPKNKGSPFNINFWWFIKNFLKI